jgi:hypothetical protein
MTRCGISEREFMDNLSLDTLVQSDARSESYGEAYSRAASESGWPWDTSQPAS